MSMRFEHKNGLKIEIQGDYGEKEVGIYISDARGEIVCWVNEEWEAEPSLLAKIAEVICCGYEYGPGSLREQFSGQRGRRRVDAGRGIASER